MRSSSGRKIGSPPGSATIGASGIIAPSSRSCFWRNSSISTVSGAGRLQVLLFSWQGLSYRDRRRPLYAAAIAFYTPDWEHIPAAYRHAPIMRARPRNLEDMIRVAEAIAGDMDFARVDLYSDGKSRVRFGEITFTPGNAFRISPTSSSISGSAVILEGGASIASGRRLRSPMRATETHLSGRRPQD